MIPYLACGAADATTTKKKKKKKKNRSTTNLRMTIRARLGFPVPLKRGGAKSRQRSDALGAMIFKPAAPADATTTKEKKKKKRRK